ncbi:MAG: sigma 54-interacting transcriptional regulator [Velocimicrobium sp.]
MAKIKVLVPNQEMSEYTKTIIADENIESCEVEVIRTADSVQAARRSIEQGAAVIVARGLQAALIKEYTKVPLVEIALTGQELGLLIQQAKKLVHGKIPKVAFIGHNSMFPDTSYMNEIFQIDMKVYNVEEHSMIEQLVSEAIDNKTDVIIGGERVLNMAANYNVQTLFLNAKEDSIRGALQIARKVLYTSQIEKENQAQFLTVLDTVYNGVIRVDGEKMVTAVNHIAQLFLNNNEKHMIAKPLEKVVPELDTEYVDKILDAKRDILNTTILLGKENFMISIAPIEVDGQVTGAIITMNRLQAALKDKKDNIQDNFFSGYLTDGDFSKIETKNKAMKNCIELARMYALSSSPVIIYGEIGTEKEIFTQGIHNSGAQKNSHFITVNCSGLTEAQQVSMLFGDLEHIGALKQAELGTLVIRDIDELCLRCQYRLLRILSYKNYMKTDIEETPAFEVRIIATSRQELGNKVKEGIFRADLYYILCAFSLYIPPLRERKEDIAILVLNYVRKYNRLYAKRVGLTNGGMEAITNGDWEGNALQIERFCERLVLTAPKRNVDEIVIHQMITELYPVPQEMNNQKILTQSMETPEAAKIRQLLNDNNGSRQKTAGAMGISTATLWRKMKKYGIAD